MQADIHEISDGKVYGLQDMVKVGCHDCAGCSDCCRDMGQSIRLDPYDMFQLEKHLQLAFKSMLGQQIELHVEDGLIFPNLKMQEEETQACAFLDGKGRCAIHAFRPGICRLFPLGRMYEDDMVRYFLLSEGCPIPNKTKMKVGKWLEIPQPVSYEKYLVTWHNFTKQLSQILQDHGEDESYTRLLNVKFVELFFIKSYVTDDFYSEFYDRLETAKSLFGIP